MSRRGCVRGGNGGNGIIGPMAIAGSIFNKAAGGTDLGLDALLADVSGRPDVTPVSSPLDVIVSYQMGEREPEQDKPNPEEKLSLSEVYKQAQIANKPLERAKTGEAFTASGTGAARLDQKIQHKEDATKDLKTALNQVKDAAAKNAAPADNKDSGADKPVPQVSQSSGPDANGKGSLVTANQKGGSLFKVKDEGYGASPQASVDVMQSWTVSNSASGPDASELPGKIEYGVEASLSAMKPGAFGPKELKDMEKTLKTMETDTKEARQAFTNWKNNPVNVARLDDIKAIRPDDMKVGDQSLDKITDPRLFMDKPVMVTSGAKMMV